MFLNKNKKDRIDSETREQYEYARKRVNQKKGLMRHFIFFLAGAILFIVLDAGLSMGHEVLMPNWFVWAIMIWAFILLIHVFNVFIMNKFMGKEWEDRQIEKLKAKQEARIESLEKGVRKDVTIEKIEQYKKEDSTSLKKKREPQSNPSRPVMITMIAAAGQQNELGKDNDLVWHLPNDFKRFKKLTTGHHIIMGRKTFESFPKPLPNRVHIIITRDTSYAPIVSEDRKEDIIVVNSIEEALEKASSQQEVFIIGGGQIYTQAIAIADKIELTRVEGTFEADAFFPEIDKKDWKKTNEERHSKDEKHNYDFTYETWVRV